VTVSGWGERWGAIRHQSGLGPSPSGPGPFAFAGGFAPAWRARAVGGVVFTGMVDRAFRRFPGEPQHSSGTRAHPLLWHNREVLR
jgi:hypothetical protein